jgi:hypothetical protein
MNLPHAVPGWRTPLAGLAIAVFLLPCCQKNGNRPVVPVQGEVFYKGQPAQGAQVIFYLQNDPEPLPLNPHGKVQEDGSFQVSTYGRNDGLPEGDYVVTITWQRHKIQMREERAVGPDLLKGRYADPNKPRLRARIEKGMSTLRFDVE